MTEHIFDDEMLDEDDEELLEEICTEIAENGLEPYRSKVDPNTFAHMRMAASFVLLTNPACRADLLSLLEERKRKKSGVQARRDVNALADAVNTHQRARSKA